MNISKKVWISLLVLIVIATLYRVIPGRTFGFAPQIAIAIFGGAIINDKKWAFLLPVLSMVVSDALYQMLYMNGVGEIYGFYEGQFINYLLFAGLTAFGFLCKNFNVGKIALASVAAPTTYFLLSNLAVWANPSPTAGLMRPPTFQGLLMTYADGLPFYPPSVASTIIFSSLFFSLYFLLTRKPVVRERVRELERISDQ